MLTSLENETIFKKAFTDKTVFKRFVKDILGIDFEVDEIETEKKFEPRPGSVAIAYDIFAESKDHRVIVEIQRVDYDSNFDRFLHYHLMAIAELQRSAKDYQIEKTIYTIIFLTAPYVIKQKTGAPVLSDVMISSFDPRDLNDQVIQIYGHKMVFLNPHYLKADTPANYHDWLKLVYESYHNPEHYQVNLENEGVKKVVDIIDNAILDPYLLHEIKISNQRKEMLKMVENKGFETGHSQGQSEERLRIARTLKQKGADVNLICDTTGLSKDIVDELN